MEGQDGQTLFYRALLTTARGSKKFKMYSKCDIYHHKKFFDNDFQLLNKISSKVTKRKPKAFLAQKVILTQMWPC